MAKRSHVMYETPIYVNGAMADDLSRGRHYAEAEAGRGSPAVEAVVHGLPHDVEPHAAGQSRVQSAEQPATHTHKQQSFRAHSL